MIVRIYRAQGTFSRSILYAELITEIETDKPPEDPQTLADEYGGDFIQLAPRSHRGNDTWQNTA